jgi:hypothetical protein
MAKRLSRVAMVRETGMVEEVDTSNSLINATFWVAK